MKTGKETKPIGIFHRHRLFQCLAVILFLLSLTVSRAEERTVWSNPLPELNRRVPAGFVVVVQPPFVAIDVLPS